MRHILFAFFFLSFLLLCYSCKRSSVSTYPILLTADSILWSNPDSALLLLGLILITAGFFTIITTISITGNISGGVYGCFRVSAVSEKGIYVGRR